jgi:hypothetical protein
LPSLGCNLPTHMAQCEAPCVHTTRCYRSPHNSQSPSQWSHYCVVSLETLVSTRRPLFARRRKDGACLCHVPRLYHQMSLCSRRILYHASAWRSSDSLLGVMCLGQLHCPALQQRLDSLAIARAAKKQKPNIMYAGLGELCAWCSALRDTASHAHQIWMV